MSSFVKEMYVLHKQYESMSHIQGSKSKENYYFDFKEITMINFLLQNKQKTPSFQNCITAHT